MADDQPVTATMDPPDLIERDRRAMEQLNRDAEVVRDVQEKRLLVDIDDAWEEHKRASWTIKFKFRDQVYEVPGVATAAFGMFWHRYCLKEIDGKPTFMIPDDKTFYELFEVAVGEQLVEAIRSSRLPASVVSQRILRPCLIAWGLFDPTESTEKKTASDGAEETAGGVPTPG